jgi:hypothetical protein
MDEENEMRAYAFLLGLLLFFALSAWPRALYACPS